MNKQNEQRLYNISRLKQMVKIFIAALCVFAGVTVLLIAANIYKCEGTIYERTKNPSTGETVEKQWQDLDAKITYLDFAFGLEHTEDDFDFVPVDQDIRFLFLYFSQLLAYALLLFQLFKLGKMKTVMTILTAIILIGVGIYSFIFFHNYAQELQQIFDDSITIIKQNYVNKTDKNATITAIDDATCPSRINVSMSIVPFLSCAYMVISGILCLVVEYLRHIIKQTSDRGAKWMVKKN